MNLSTDSDVMRSEYDFSKGIRGKHARAFHTGADVITLEPEVAKVFKDSAAVNKALKMLMELAQAQIGKRVRKGT